MFISEEHYIELWWQTILQSEIKQNKGARNTAHEQSPAEESLKKSLEILKNVAEKCC